MDFFEKKWAKNRRFIRDKFNLSAINCRFLLQQWASEARALHCRFFHRKIGIFRYFLFFSDFSSSRFSIAEIFSMLTENQFFGKISAEKNDFLFPGGQARL